MDKRICSVVDFNNIANKNSWNEYIFDTDNNEVIDSYQRCVIHFFNMSIIGNCIKFENNRASEMYFRNIKHIVVCDSVMIGTVFKIVFNNNMCATFIARKTA